MIEKQQGEDESLVSDIESSKSCSHAACRRVATHCSSLLDALLIFKTWFIQRQNELNNVTDRVPVQSRLPDPPTHVVPYDSTSCDTSHLFPDPARSMVVAEAEAPALAERDWALSRVRRMETQMSRLRSTCLAMRVQLEAGLRFKSEAEQVKRDLEMALTTITHYQKLMEEGNHLREDLRSELSRARKEASIARSQLQQASCVSRPGTMLHPCDELTVPRTTRSVDRADMLTTSLLALASSSNAESTPHNSPVNITHLRSLLERQHKWCDSLDREANELRGTVRVLSEKEVDHMRLLDTIRKHVLRASDLICSVHAVRPNQQANPFGAVLSLQWLAVLAEHLCLSLPQNLAKIATKFSTVIPNEVVQQSSETTSIGGGGGGVKRKRRTLTKGKSKQQKRSKKHVTESNLDVSIHSSASSVAVSPRIACSPLPTTPSGTEFLEQVLSELSDITDQSSDLLATPALPKLPKRTLKPSNSPHPVTPLAPTPETPTSRLGSSVAHRAKIWPKTTVSPEQIHRNAVSPTVNMPISPAYPVDLDDGAVESAVSSPSTSIVESIIDEPTKHVNSDPSLSTGTLVLPMGTTVCQEDMTEKTNQTQCNPVSSSSSCPSSANTATPAGLSHDVSTMRLDETEVFATRVLSSPVAYRPLPRTKPPEPISGISSTLLSLLDSTYSPEQIHWFDEFTSDAILGKLVDISEPPITVSAVSSDLSRPGMSPADDQLTESLQPIASSNKADATQLAKECTAYLSQKITCSPSNKLVESLHVHSTDIIVNVIWSSFVSLLAAAKPNQLDKRETQFLNLTSSLLDYCSIHQLADWLLVHMNELRTSMQLAVSTRFVYRLFSTSIHNVMAARIFFVKLLRVLFTACSTVDHFNLQMLPYVVDACQSRFSQCWQDVQVSSQSQQAISDTTAFSYVIATVQALLVWQETFFDKGLCTNKRGQKSSAVELVLSRLHSSGWLSERRIGVPRSASVIAAVLSQQNYRLRCLALRLVDVCVQVRRTGNDSTVSCLNVDLGVTEAACSLTILLSAMAFVTGDDALICHQDADPDGMPTTVIRSHQRKRRSRQTRRHQMEGLLGWLITRRLLPWLTKQFKLVRTQNTSESHVLLDRLMIITTDVLVLGTYLLSLRSNSEQLMRDLRATLFHSGRHLVQLMEKHRSALSTQVGITCCTRLLAFAPMRSAHLLIHFARSLTDNHATLVPVPTSYLWSPISMDALIEQSLQLLTHSVPPVLDDSFIVSFQHACRIARNMFATAPR